MQQLLTGKTRLPGFTDTWAESTLGNSLGRQRRIITKSSVPRVLGC